MKREINKWEGENLIENYRERKPDDKKKERADVKGSRRVRKYRDR